MTQRKYDPVMFSMRLKLLMREKDFTQESLAMEIHCSRKTVNQYCNGKAIPDDVRKEQLAKLFEVDVNYLMGVSKYRNEFERIDSELGDEGIRNIRFQMELVRRFQEDFNCDVSSFTDEEQEQLDREIRDFIQYKVDSLKAKKT